MLRNSIHSQLSVYICIYVQLYTMMHNFCTLVQLFKKKDRPLDDTYAKLLSIITIIFIVYPIIFNKLFFMKFNITHFNVDKLIMYNIST